MALILNSHQSRLIKGDVFRMLRQEPAESVHLALADPPYGWFLAPWDKAPDYGSWIAETLRILKPGGVAYVFGPPEVLAERWNDFPAPRRLLIWHYRNKAVPGARFWGRSFDGILAFSKGTPRFFPDQIREPYSDSYANLIGKTRAATPGRFGSRVTKYADNGGAWPRDVLIGPAVAGGLGRQEGVGHPCQKPLWLLRKLILSSTLENDTVAELFAGSGSGVVAATELGRRWLAIEREPSYLELILRRLGRLEPQTDMRK